MLGKSSKQYLPHGGEVFSVPGSLEFMAYDIYIYIYIYIYSPCNWQAFQYKSPMPCFLFKCQPENSPTTSVGGGSRSLHILEICFPEIFGIQVPQPKPPGAQPPNSPDTNDCVNRSAQVTAPSSETWICVMVVILDTFFHPYLEVERIR